MNISFFLQSFGIGTRASSSRGAKHARRAASTILFAAVALASMLSESSATIPAAPVPKNQRPSPVVSRLLNQAQAALSSGDIKHALIDLKLAAGMEPNNATVIFRLGLALNRNGEYAKAEEELRYARSLGIPDEQILGPTFESMLTLGENQQVLDLFADPDPDNRSQLAATVLRARASAMQTLGDLAGAESAMNRSLAIRRDFDSLMTAARIAYLQQKLASAQSLSDEALKLHPGNIDALIFKIGVALATGDPARAQSIAEGLVSGNPRSLVARLARIKVDLATGKTDKARPDVDRILKETPNMAIAVYYRAVILARTNHLSAAWTVAHALPSEFLQSDSEFAVSVAEMAVGAGFLDSAAMILDKAVFKNPSLLDVRLKLVEIRLLQKSPQYALNTLALVEDSKDPRVSVLYAKAYLALGHGADAQKYIEHAIALGGGEALAALGQNIALRSLHDWLQHHPDNLAVRKQYALLLMRFGKFADARIQYEQLVKAEPSDGVALNNLSWLVLNDDPSRALLLAAAAVKLQPASADFLDSLGCVQMNRSDMKGAVNSLQRAHALRAGDPEITYHLALALDGTGARAAAKPLLAAAVAQGGFADFVAAKKLLAYWH